MTRFDCRRCDWQADEDALPGPQSQLAEHSAGSRHPLCVVCHRSLGDIEPQTCLPCLADTRQRLAEVVDSYAMLPENLDKMPSSSDWRRTGPRSDEAPLPGGDALGLLSPGSAGRWASGDVHAADNLPADAPSVAFELSRWEDDWREWRDEPAADEPANVVSAVGYLTRNLGWASDHHPAFDEFATDVRRLLSRIQTATATAERDDTGAACHTCGVDLRRAYGEPKPCHHERPAQGLQWLGNRYEKREEMEDRLAAWEAKHQRCQQGGLEDSWKCPRCLRVYTDEQYRLAVAAEMQMRKDEAHYWVPIPAAARLVDRTHATVKRWIDDGTVESVCDVKDRRLRVLLRSVFDADRRRGRRRRAA